MWPNVFLRSTIRQPGKVVCLVLVAVLTVFAFVSRASEYLLIKQETDRLAESYAAIGTLASATGGRWADTREAAAYLEEKPYVKTVNTYDCTIGIIQEDICNADLDNQTNAEAIDTAFAALEKDGRYLVRALYYPFQGGRVTYDEAGASTRPSSV